MRRSLFLLFAIPLLLGSPIRAKASCGSEGSCPLERPDTHPDARLLFDVSQLYIDQNQPMAGTRDVAVGAIPGDHDEVRTLNRVTNFRVAYRTSHGWAIDANLPWIRRTHEHIHHDVSEDHYERWNDDGLGDLDLSASRVFTRSGGSAVRVGLGLRAPTGTQRAALTEEGDPIEPSARLGSGAWGITGQLGIEWRFRAPAKSAAETVPLRLTAAGRYDGRGVEEYRHGAEAQLHLATEYPALNRVAILLQTNYRVRAKDDPGDPGDEDAANTGGASVYVTPGLRYDALPGFSIYGLAQFPVWERVNGIQVVAKSNMVVGISRSLF